MQSSTSAARPSQNEAPLKPLLIDIGQFMALLRIGRSTANQMIREKRVQSLLIGRARRVVLADAERLVTDALSREQR